MSLEADTIKWLDGETPYVSLKSGKALVPERLAGMKSWPPPLSQQSDGLACPLEGRLVQLSDPARV